MIKTMKKRMEDLIMRFFLKYSLLIIVLCLLPTVLHATVITFKYTAFDIIGGGTVEGMFGYDTSFPDLDPREFQGIYKGGFWTGVITGGSQHGAKFSSTNTEVIIQNDVLGMDAILFVAQRSVFFNFQLLDITGLPLSSDRLPSFQVGTDLLTLFPDYNFLALDDAAIGLPSDNMSSYNFISVNVIPEPPTCVLLVIGFLCIVGMAYRKNCVGAPQTLRFRH